MYAVQRRKRCVYVHNCLAYEGVYNVVCRVWVTRSCPHALNKPPVLRNLHFCCSPVWSTPSYPCAVHDVMHAGIGSYTHMHDAQRTVGQYILAANTLHKTSFSARLCGVVRAACRIYRLSRKTSGKTLKNLWVISATCRLAFCNIVFN